MQTTAGTGKYLTKKYQTMRARALIDRSEFTDAELEWLEIGAGEGIVPEHDPGNLIIPTQPIDPFTSSRVIDAKKLNGRTNQ